ncbi:MAG: hypothetical protein ACYC36_05085 [Bellilinea sp.]
MPLSDFFDLTEQHAPTHNWALVSHKCQNVTLDDLAKTLAIAIVKSRCKRCEHHFQAWLAKVEKDIALPESSLAALRAFLIPTFGPPGIQFEGGQLNHLEGFIGEWLWYFLTLENPIDEIAYQIPPGFKSTDPGGDGFIVHRLPNRLLMFRLWEIKKFSPTSYDTSQRVVNTVKIAYSQLNLKALEYLARITATEQESEDPELEEFFGRLPDLWVDASPQAAAGVSIATSSNFVEEDCFDDFGTQFPRFTQPVRLRGMITGVLDFSKLSLLVQENVWKGL